MLLLLVQENPGCRHLLRLFTTLSTPQPENASERCLSRKRGSSNRGEQGTQQSRHRRPREFTGRFMVTNSGSRAACETLSEGRPRYPGLHLSEGGVCETRITPDRLGTRAGGENE